MQEFTPRLPALLQSVLQATFILLTISCRDNKAKEVFEKPAGERLQQNSHSLREKLKASPQGWIISYKPSSKETGAYQFLFRFVNDTEVETASDFSSNDLNWKKSEYAILTGSTTKLSFSTACPLHQLSDSDFSPIPGSRGSGLKGDFEFLYYGENEQGDLIFRTNRTNKTLLFKKATENSSKDIELSFLHLERVITGKSVYRSLLEYKNGSLIRSHLDFPYNARVIRIREAVKKEGNRESVLKAGYLTGFGLMPKGIYVDSVMRNSGEFLRDVVFTYNETEGCFEKILEDGARLIMGDSRSPIIPVNGQKDFLDTKLTSYVFYLHKDVDTERLTTTAFNTFIDKVSPVISVGFALYLQSSYLEEKIDYISIIGKSSVSNGWVRERLIYEDKGDRLVITRNGYRDPSSAIRPNHEAPYNEFMDFLTDPQGFYVENLGKITEYDQNIFTFTSAKDPSMRFALYHQ